MLLFDHNEDNWRERYVSRGRENGAATYSREIVKYQLSIWERQLKKHGIDKNDVVISTCPLLSHVEDVPESRLAVQYLHTYRYDDPVSDAETVIKRLGYRQNIVFVSAYKALCYQLKRRGIPAIFVPMTIDAKTVRSSVKPSSDFYQRAVYFGNVTGSKVSVYSQLRQEFEGKGWQLDIISEGKFNGNAPLTQKQAWQKITEYQYGVGVGRCALEMMALGLKVMISGAEFGGLVVNERDFEAQTESNFNGRVVTFNRSIASCIDCFDESVVGVTNDIKKLSPAIERQVSDFLSNANL